MSDYQFLSGNGYLPAKAAKIAREHGAKLINHCDSGCACGYGCPTQHDCPRNRRHWFTAPNMGEPFDSELAREVEQALLAAKIKLT